MFPSSNALTLRDDRIVGKLWARLVSVVHTVRRERRISADMAYLSTFDDHMLNDIGIIRADLERYLRGTRG